MWEERMTDIRMTDMVELIQGLKYQLKGTKENTTEGRKIKVIQRNWLKMEGWPEEL